MCDTAISLQTSASKKSLAQDQCFHRIARITAASRNGLVGGASRSLGSAAWGSEFTGIAIYIIVLFLFYILPKPPCKSGNRPYFTGWLLRLITDGINP